jgi:uncharacterized repeat protein (TIGR03803 family)
MRLGKVVNVSFLKKLAVLSALLVIVSSAEAQTETILYNFTDGSDGGYPNARLTFDGKGNIYGTTYSGGDFGYGTVFELSPKHGGGWTEKVLYSFCSAPNCTDGATPYFSYVMFDSSGNLYGTAKYGGANQDGVVFKLSSVKGKWKETVLYNFCSQTECADGSNPVNGLLMDSAGNLYGITLSGGTGVAGTVFEVSPSGGGWTEQVIYNVATSNAGLTMNTTGHIFGVGSSTVFELSPNGGGGWNPTVIYTFTSTSNPQGTPVLDAAGNLFGTTTGGGSHGGGTVYELTLGKKGKWTRKNLYSFSCEDANGCNSWAGVVLDTSGNIYGTALVAGKKEGYGNVFELVAPVGTGSYEYDVLFGFYDPDPEGEYPYGGLILDGAGNLYGTTIAGGSDYGGVVFEVTP